MPDPIGNDANKSSEVKFTGKDEMRVSLPYLDSVPVTGREEEIEAIRGALGGRVTQIVAIGGAGKSRLAAEIALQYPTGAIWHRCSAGTADYQVTDAIRDHYNLSKEASEDQILAALDNKPPLIVLDNAEDLEAGSERRKKYVELCTKLVHRTPVLLTSRVSWDELKPRKEIKLKPLNIGEATQIALDFASADDIQLSEAEARELADAARLHPRLIEFAVRQLHERRKERVLRLLHDLEHEELQDVLEEMIRRTVRQMAAEARHGADADALLRCLTACRGTFDMQAISALRPDGMDEDRLDDALTTLQRWGFVRRVSEERYSIDDVTTSSLPPDEDARVRHFNHYSDLHARDVNINKDERHHPTIERDWANIRAALEWGWGGRTKEAVDLVIAFHFYMQLHVSLMELRVVTEDAYREAVRIDYKFGQANTLYALAELAGVVSEYSEARQYLEKALVNYEAIGSQMGTANTLMRLGDISRMQARHNEAQVYLQRALRVFDQHSLRTGVANTLLRLGHLAHLQSSYDKAREFYSRAVEIFEQLGDKHGEANTLRSLGDMVYMEAKYVEAQVYLERALKVFEQLGDRHGKGNTLLGLGEIAAVQAHYDEAQVYMERAFIIFEQLSAHIGSANSLEALGELALVQADYGKARMYLEQSLKVFEEIGDFPGRLNALTGLARLERAIGNIENACNYFHRMLTLAESHPVFAAHPTTQKRRDEYRSFGCSAAGGDKGEAEG
jgi:tetratricopeptide (TPR) repeat protein